MLEAFVNTPCSAAAGLRSCREIKKAVADAAAREAKLQVATEKRDKGALLAASFVCAHRGRGLMPTACPLCGDLFCG